MIRVVRPPPPDSYDSARIHRAVNELMEFYDRPRDERLQHRPNFNADVWKAMRPALLALQHRKCCFCETPLHSMAMSDIEHYRPKSGTDFVDRPYSDEHYAWLAYDWDNLMMVCRECNMGKGRKFPIAGEPCRIGATSLDELAREKPLILNPFLDDPADHLRFGETGLVDGLTDRGRVTIAILRLNRPGLIEARRDAAYQARAVVARIAELAVSDRSAQRERELLRNVDAQPHAAVWRETLGAIQRRFQTDVATPKQEAAAVKTATRVVERVHIRNVRALANVDLAFPKWNTSDTMPWLMLIGENAVGKSTILQAIALALSRRSGEPRHFTSTEAMLRRGAPSGSVAVWLSGQTMPIRLRLAEDSARGAEPPKLVVLGYGATRLVPIRRVESDSGASDPVANLFDPFVPLVDPARWIAKLTKTQFGHAARALKDVLGLPNESHLRRTDDAIFVDLHGEPIQLHELSDGYQSMLGLAIDIMAKALRSSGDEFEKPWDEAEAIVLLDEIGAHLHPRWKMNVVGGLRRAFQRMQFISTTHDPLCLRGLGNGEVAVLRRPLNGTPYLVPDLPAVEGLQVDQLLTSEYFGLSSTLDPDIEAEFNEYYGLLSRTRLTTAEAARVKDLRERLTKLQFAGTTRRERLMLDEVDHFLAAEQRTTSREQALRLKSRLRRRLAKLQGMDAPET